MPAAAVIPAPIAYIKVVAVKKLVVGFLLSATGPLNSWYQVRSEHFPGDMAAPRCVACFLGLLL